MTKKKKKFISEAEYIDFVYTLNREFSEGNIRCPYVFEFCRNKCPYETICGDSSKDEWRVRMKDRLLKDLKFIEFKKILGETNG